MKSGESYSALRVLVVEDNENMSRLLREVLRALGVGEVYSAASGPEALRVLSRVVPDVLLTDLALGKMSGIELTRRIRRGEDSINPYVPIIMVTGHADQRRIAEARDAGIHEFVAKPVSPVSLARYLSEVVERPRPFVSMSSYFGPDRRRRVVNRRSSDRRERSGKIISPDEIAAYVERLREKIAEGPVERAKVPPGSEAIAFRAKAKEGTA